MDRSRLWCRFAIVLSVMVLALGAFSRSTSAQTFRGTILGTVTDASGGAVAGAKVSIKNVDTGVVRDTETTADGEYRVPELPVGNYSVTITKDGFEKSVTSNVAVDVSAEKRVDAALKPGAITQEVTVSGEELPQVETTNDTIGGTLTQNTIKEIPVNGRDYTKLIYLTPGVAGSPDQISDSPGSFGVFSVNGARGRANNFLLDGTDMNDGYRNDPAINEAGVFGTPATILPIDAVSEVRVLSNYEPEFGRNAGGVINIVTKSGTNALHGNFFDYFRNNALDARNFFNDKGNPQAPFHNNQFGGSIGGPIVPNKTFFFGDYEGWRERVGVVSVATIPTVTSNTTLTNDNESQGGTTSPINPVIASLLARNPFSVPASAAASCPTFNPANPSPSCTLTTSVISPSFNRVDSAIIKLDHNINQNNILSGRYYFGDSNQAFPLALAGGGILPGFNTVTPTRVQLVSLSYVTVLSPSKVNEARFGWNRFAEGFFPQDQSFAPSSIGLNTGAGAANAGLPVINISGFPQIGANKSDPRHRVDTNWQAFDNFSWKLGKHDVKMGYEYRRTSIAQFLDTNYRGTIKFAGLASFLEGAVASGSPGGSQSSGNSVRNTFENNHGLYIQDSYHWSSRVTFNAGLRWDYFGVVGEKNDLFSNITNLDTAGATLTLSQVGAAGSGISQLYQPDYKNFAPRASVAWDVFGSGKTVVRAGWGLFFDAFSQDFVLGHLPFNCSFCPGPAYNPFGPAPISSVSPVGGTIVSGQPIFAPPTPGGSIFAVNHNIRTPYLENFNLNLQQQLSSKVVLQVGYVGSEGHHLFNFYDLNQPGQTAITSFDQAFAAENSFVFGGKTIPCTAGGPGCINSGLTNSGVTRVFGNNPFGALFVNQQESAANSNYNSLQASLRVNDWHGFTSITNFVWSHSLDDASDSEDFVPNAAQPNDSTRPFLEYGNSNFDIRRRFTWIIGYELPHMSGSWQRLKNGWGVDSTVTLQDGQPFQLNYNFEGDFSGSGEGFDRPDVIGPIVYNSHNPAQFLNLTAFMTPCTALTGTPLAAVQAAGLVGTDQNCVPGTRHFGDLGRDALRGPTFKQMDFAIYKNTAITERLNMQIRAEFFNLLNHPNFSNPFLPAFIADAGQQGIGTNGVGGLTNPFYSINATGDVGIGNPFVGGGGPRGIQLAAKFSF